MSKPKLRWAIEMRRLNRRRTRYSRWSRLSSRYASHPSAQVAIRRLRAVFHATQFRAVKVVR